MYLGRNFYPRLHFYQRLLLGESTVNKEEDLLLLVNGQHAFERIETPLATSLITLDIGMLNKCRGFDGW
jgi:hypothetical protein